MKIEREPFSHELFEELIPLARKCWAENTIVKAESCAFYGERDFEIEPDLETYQRQSDLGNLVIFTLREDSLKGYIVGFLYRSWHHKKILCANADSIYLDPDYRSYAVVMIERFEKEMRAMNVHIIGWPTPPEGSVYGLLKAKGYVLDDVVMEKRLCAL